MLAIDTASSTRLYVNDQPPVEIVRCRAALEAGAGLSAQPREHL